MGGGQWRPGSNVLLLLLLLLLLLPLVVVRVVVGVQAHVHEVGLFGLLLSSLLS